MGGGSHVRNNQFEHDDFLFPLDHTHPRLVTNLFHKIGLRENTAALLEMVWTNQHKDTRSLIWLPRSPPNLFLLLSLKELLGV